MTPNRFINIYLIFLYIKILLNENPCNHFINEATLIVLAKVVLNEEVFSPVLVLLLCLDFIADLWKINT
jgi:hypothetical protein